MVVEARARNVGVANDDLDGIAAVLTEFKDKCKNQIQQHRSRAARICDAERWLTGDGGSRIQQLRIEVMNLRQLCAGREDDVRDFDMVLRQLNCAEDHYRQLDSRLLSCQQFEQLLKHCAETTEAEFGEDGPPLDNEAIYVWIGETIRAERRRAAEEWIDANVPTTEAIARGTPEQVQRMESLLDNPPQFLSEEQMDIVAAGLQACEQRLDEARVEGLVVRYQALSEAAKRTFLERIGVLVGR